MTKNAYIHIPFCRSKCNYCSFVSFDKIDLKKAYLEALMYEIKTIYKGEFLKTLYFGGGTPSVLTMTEIKKIISLFKTSQKTEITFEINPNDTTEKYLKELKQLGINRISIGAQTFNDKILKLIGRKHNSKQIKIAVKTAQKAGFENISVDLIYGLPTQTVCDFEKDLQKAVELNIQHISLYGLKIEAGCFFAKKQPASLPNSDTQADMYLAAIKILQKNNFKHYEISNFSKKGFKSKHNLNYWNNNNYYGFGLSASGYENKTRYTNQTDLKKYIKNPLLKITKDKLTEKEILEEAIFLGFRKIPGINTKKINKNFNINFGDKYKTILDKYLISGHLKKTKIGFALTRKGILVSNSVLCEFLS